MSDIFISYASADKDRAELLANAFSQQGWSVWWDRQIPPGQSFDEVIETALNSARCVIVLWSKDSVSSRWVKTEAAEAAAKGILVPALIDNVQIPLEFKRIEAADLSDWQTKSPHSEFDQLLKTIADFLSNSYQPLPQLKQRLTTTKSQTRHWWKTLPGILTFVACVVIILVGTIFASYQSEFFRDIEVKPHINPIKPPNSTENQAITPSQATEPVTQIPHVDVSRNQEKQINLLAADNGGQLLVASSDDWKATIDGKEGWGQISYGLGKEAVYGFKDEQTAVFDRFTMLITETGDNNVKNFELFVGNDSPTGAFESIGKFQTQNVKLFKTPYQEFKFSPVTARFFKVKLLDTYDAAHPIVHEFQLFGAMK
jgi:TIR domain